MFLFGKIVCITKFETVNHGTHAGLDPARPRFESAGPGDRLDKGDAHFVDVIHTNSGTLVQVRPPPCRR